MNYSAMRIAQAANAIIPDRPEKAEMHQAMRNNRDMLLVGIVWEMATLKPSYPEISAAVGCSHSSARNHLDKWRELPWQDRFGWLRLVEGRIARETHSVDAALL